MKEPIIIITGAASPYTKEVITREQAEQEALVATLQENGYEPVVIGNSLNGFTLEDVTRALQDHPTAANVIVHAHGNIQNNRHFMRTTPNSTAWSDSFYKALARGQRPLSIFLNSCGASAGYMDAVKHSFPGTTVMCDVDSNSIDSYTTKPTGFAVAPRQGLNTAELFGLNLLCNGLTTAHHAPHLAICDFSDDGNKNVIDLWYHTRYENLFDRNGRFKKTERDTVFALLDGICDTDRIKKAMGHIEYHGRAVQAGCYREPGMPTIEYEIDDKQFKTACIESDVFGPMCAITYIVWRENFGAFQTWDSKRYLKPSVA